MKSEGKPFTVQYNGQSIEFSPLREGERLIGYRYKHPERAGFKCAWNWIDTETGTRHALTVDPEGRATIRGSLACPQGCGWHVMIENGVARDC